MLAEIDSLTDKTTKGSVGWNESSHFQLCLAKVAKNVSLVKVAILKFLSVQKFEDALLDEIGYF